MSLRVKLLLAAALLLVVPLAGYRFVLAMESFLRANQVEAAASAARTLALALESRPELLPSDRRAAARAPELFVHPLAAEPAIDGYPADWAELAPPLHAEVPALRAGLRGDALFLVLAVPHPRAAPGAPLAAVRLLLEDAPGFRRAWLVDVATPGPIAVLEVPPADGAVAPGHDDARIAAAVGRSGAAVVVELRLPLALTGPRLGFELLRAGSRAPEPVPATGAYALLRPPPGLDALLDELAPVGRARLRVTDTAGRVLAESGRLPAAAAADRLGAAMARLLAADEPELLSLAPGTLALAGPELASALAGSAAARLRRDDSGEATVVTAAHPLRRGARVTGALVLEESTSSIQALGRRALLELLATAALAFTAGTAGVLLVAARAAQRLRSLRDRAAAAIDEHGRVRHRFQAPGGRDEIGDLGRSFQSTVSRLQDYQEYLEQLARRLSHELRTPLAVIRSSLDNLEMTAPAGDPDIARYAARIRGGMERLDGLIRRMSEAARLEHALSDTDRGPTDLAALARSAVEGHAAAWPQQRLRVDAGDGELTVCGSPDLLLQALDKLLGNARDFAVAGSTVTVGVMRAGAHARVWVDNHGPPLPQTAPRSVFDSMVSERPAGDGEHLGLGLYVVRLVAEFHGGRAFAHDLPDGSGVRVGLELPLVRSGAGADGRPRAGRDRG